jgi:hypothetical protein
MMPFHLSPNSLDWAFAHALRFGDSDIFPPHFEFQALAFQSDDVKDFLTTRDLLQWTARSKQVCLTPKGRYAYRVSTRLDPLDSLIYLALVHEVGELLEQRRVPASEAVVLAHRFQPTSDGHLYDPAYGWRQFIKTCQQKLDSSSATHVVVADIADFFPRLYHHRIENTLNSFTNSSPQARCIFRLINQWAGTPSYGIPVGPSPSRLIAEATIHDVDQHLLSEGATYCRYSDDFRIFCSSRTDAYDKLSSLALALFHNHGFTLQPSKTFIVSGDEFSERFLTSPESEELSNLQLGFQEFLEAAGVAANPYAELDYHDLDPAAKSILDELNLEDLLRDQLGRQELDIGLVRFLLRRLAQLNDSDIAEELLDNADECYPVLASIMDYLNALRDVPDVICQAVGAKVLALLDHSVVAHLPYHRCWLLSLFANSDRWGQTTRLPGMYDRAIETFTRRKLTLALGRAGSDFWFRMRRDAALDMDPWERRAFIASASCLPHDEAFHWYRSVGSRLDPLESFIVNWVRRNPF